MKYTLFKLKIIVALALLATSSLLVYGQTSTAPLSGLVTDPTGAVVAGASVTVRNNATTAEFRAATASNGTFTVPALDAGTYTVAITAPGFKQAIVNDVKLNAGVPGSVRITLEIGQTNETVTIQGGGEIVQTQSAAIATTLQVNQIAKLPLVSRNALNFVIFLPGVNTTTDNRNSTINGLPETAISITLDGINIQDNFNKTGDGLFARVSPRLDSVEEVTVSTATPGSETGSHGAVQVKFVTRRGSNDFHGSLYEYHRNPVLNSNYWFTNRDGAPFNKATGLVCDNSTPQQAYDPDKCRAERARILLNQFGGRVGGPVVLPKSVFGPLGFDGRDRAFFFVNYEEFRLPNAAVRNRTILNPLSQTGVFQYNVTSGGVTTVRTVNLLQLAANNGHTATIDPVIGKLLQDIRNSTVNNGNITQLTDPNLQRFTFTNTGNNTTYFPTARFDVNLTSNHNLALTWSYQKLNSAPDFLNSRDPVFPGFPNKGSQIGDRYTGSLTLRSTLSPTLVNEARAGLSGGPSRFNPDASRGSFSGAVANQNGFSLDIDAAGISNADNTTAPSRRNPLLRDFADTLTWTRGSHSMSFGFQFTQLNLTLQNETLVPNIDFGVNSNDPADSMFRTANFPGASSTNLTAARNLYAVLTGRVTAISADARLNEQTGKYEYLGIGVQRGRQRELGIFAQDSWRVRPSLTLNYGLRWEFQGGFTPLNNSYSTIPVEGLWGVSGVGNLFKPGTLTGNPSQFILFKEGENSYNNDYKNFAPSFGFAWSPSARDGWLKRLVGDGGQTVIRGGYSIGYNRNGLGDFSGQFGANPGVSITVSRNLTLGNLVGGSLGALPVLFREPNRLGPPPFPATPSYPLTDVVTGDAQIFDPNIKVPYAQSWSFGIQREITKNMAIEVRYVGTRNLRGWTEYNLNDNEQNIFENGMLEEFRLAQANLQANIAAGRGSNFRYFGPGTGTSPLPITLAYFSGVPAAQASDQTKYGSSNFASSTWVNELARFNPDPLGYAASLHSDAGRRTNALNAGLPPNFFLTNPDLRGGAIFFGNGGYTRYDGLQTEFRRRLSRGLLVQANYTFAKSFSSSRFSFRTPRVNTLGSTLKHAFKVNWIYELPFGSGKTFFGNAGGFLDKLVGGWEFHGTGRIQSGNILDFGNVRLVGMTREEFQDLYGLYFDDANKVIYNLPKDIIDNTIKAFSTSATSATGYGASGPPTGRYLAPVSTVDCLQIVEGACAPHNLYVNGPMFTRFDLSALKRFKINERFNFELRGEFLNAFNNINFRGVTGASSSQTLGQITTAYTDSSNTQDPGGRLVQIVLRLNF
jgi:hypothetical protein